MSNVVEFRPLPNFPECIGRDLAEDIFIDVRKGKEVKTIASDFTESLVDDLFSGSKEEARDELRGFLEELILLLQGALNETRP